MSGPARTRIGVDRRLGEWRCYSVDPLELSRYPVSDQVWYSYLRLGRLLERAGMQVSSITEKGTPLDDFSVIAVVRPRREITEDEISRYVDYVARGGGLLLAQNWLQPDLSNAQGTAQLAEALGVRLIGLGQCTGVVPAVNLGDVNNFRIHVLDRMGTHDVARNVSKIAMHETCGLESLGAAQVVAGGADHAGVVVGRLGRGRFAVVADTEVFNDLLLGLFDNERFALNLFHWLAYPVFGDDPVERLLQVLHGGVPDLEGRLARMTHVGSRPLDIGRTGAGAALLESCAMGRPRDLLRGLLSSAELVDLESRFFNASPLPDDERISRFLRRLGFELPEPCFGRERYRRLLQEAVTGLQAGAEDGLLGGCWQFVNVFEQAMREIVEGYGPLLDPDPVRLLMDLGGKHVNPERLTMGMWTGICRKLLGRLQKQGDALEMLPPHDWRALEKKIATVAEKVVPNRNKMAHSGAFHQVAETLRTQILEAGGDVAADCISSIPEVVRVRRAAEDRFGRRRYVVATDYGDKRTLLTSGPLSPAVTYYHLYRAEQEWNLNPVVFQRRDLELG